MNFSSVLLKGVVQIEPVVGPHGIGGELDVPCTTNRLYGGPNAFGRRKRPFGFHTRTLMSRPHMTRVPRTVPGGEQQLDNRGNRSGRERSSPTWGHECCGVTGWRKCVGLARGNERPPLALPLSFLNIKDNVGNPTGSFEVRYLFPRRYCYLSLVNFEHL